MTIRALMSDEEVDERYTSIVIDTPVRFTDVRGMVVERLLPLIFTRVGDDVVVPPEQAIWSKNEAVDTPYKALRFRVSTFQRILDFYNSTGSPALDTPYSIDCMIDAYMYLRLASPSDISRRPFPLWEKVSAATVKRELAAMDALARSASRYFGKGSPLSEALAASNGVFGERLPKRVNSKIWAHLDSNWVTYQSLSRLKPTLSGPTKKLARSEPKVLMDQGVVMTCAEVDAIIDNTDNRSYQALFTACAGLGRRFSEYLHIFRCDYVPAHMSQHFVDYDSSDNLLIFAHPSRSTWTGKIDDFSSNREEYLRTEYNGLVPRTMALEKSYKAGWKGMVFYHKAAFMVPIWLETKYATRFEQLASELIQVVKLAGTAGAHPYLFVTSSNNSAYGMPMRIAQVEEAFNRAAKKAGLFGKPGVHLHGLRHHYVWFLKNVLKFTDEQVQLALGHSTIGAQRSYGKELTAIYNMAKEREVLRAA